MSMTSDEAKKIVNDTFNHAYDKKNFRNFINNLFNNAKLELLDEPHGKVADAFKNKIASYKRIAKFVDDDGNMIDTLVVKIKTKRTLENARTMQRNFIARYLNGSRGGQLKDAALVAFYSDESPDWRFSLVKMDYQLDVQAQKIKKELTPARRYSFLVGENEQTHTAQKQFLEPLQKSTITLADLETAFNIEIVGKEFFAEYRSLYEELHRAITGYLTNNPTTSAEFDDKQVSLTDFAKKLLGQIVFLYFLQKKGWLGVAKDAKWGTGAKYFLQKLYKKEYCPYDNFFNEILEPLFYEALATERSDNIYQPLNCKIPFLNGGLFEPINDYDWQHIKILLDNAIFEKIFEVFGLYNFTVHEDEPLEKEVAIDPEMLGKIFENLLDGHERKGTGTFYTPREIVHYMCQESLLNYLDAKLNTEQGLNIPQTDLQKFVFESEVVQEYENMAEQKRQADANYKGKYQSVLANIRTHAEALDTALANIKICDPAIGSGAFPVGMMNEIVRLRALLSSYLPPSNKRSAYDFKYHAIEQSLYGVDIAHSAVDIAKLRLWLSLVVDENNPDGIYPLPNLDYKIIEGDALLGVNTEVDLFNQKTINNLEQAKNEYFSTTNAKNKHSLKQRIDNYVQELTGDKNTFDFNIHFGEVFINEKGFDVVIANPPYIQLQKDGGVLGKLYQPLNYHSFIKTGDIYQLFYEKAVQIAKPNGHLCFITSNKWMRADYGKKSRAFFGQYNPKLLIDLGPNIFETATVDTNILLLQKAENQHQMQATTITQNNHPLYHAVTQHAVTLPSLTAQAWVILPAAELQLQQKIAKIGTPLYLWDIKINRGILTGYNKAFIIDNETKERLVEQDAKSAEIIKPLLRGRDVKRWHADWQGLWVIFVPAGWTDKHRDKEKAEAFFSACYPAIYQWLKSIGDKHQSKGKGLYQRDDMGDYWWELRPCKYHQDFMKEKIIYSEIVQSPQFYLDTNNYFPEATVFIMTGKNLKFLLSLFNSKPFNYLFQKFYAGGGLGEKGYRYKKVFFEQIPIPPITTDNQPLITQLEALTDSITARKAENPTADTSADEARINQLVYQLYALTSDEIDIIEQA